MERSYDVAVTFQMQIELVCGRRHVNLVSGSCGEEEEEEEEVEAGRQRRGVGIVDGSWRCLVISLIRPGRLDLVLM